MYSIAFSDIAVTAQQDFFELLPATQKPIRLHACFISQISDVGDAAEEMLRVSIIRGHTTSGSGGASVTPGPLDSVDTAAGATCERNNTTIASAGTGLVLHSEAFNIRSGWVYVPTPECRPRCANASIIVVRLLTTPADSLTMSGTLYFEEV
jgi:hypothetical protein